MEQELTEALLHRRDRDALDLIKAHPELINESIVRLALDNGCIRVIRYLRQKNKITLEGKAQRDKERYDVFHHLLNEADRNLPDIEKIFKR